MRQVLVEVLRGYLEIAAKVAAALAVIEDQEARLLVLPSIRNLSQF
jgi:hypothetical protein